MSEWFMLLSVLIMLLVFPLPDFKIRFLDGKLGVEYMSDGVFKKAIHLIVISIWIYK